MTVYRRNPLIMTVLGANPGPRTRKGAENALDKEISSTWHRLMSGVQVSIMDIPKIFRDVKLEVAAGMSVSEAVMRVGARYQVNRNPGRRRYRRNGAGFSRAVTQVEVEPVHIANRDAQVVDLVSDATHISVYLRMTDGLARWVKDFRGNSKATIDHAMAYANRLAREHGSVPVSARRIFGPRENPLAEAMIAGATGALVSHALQSNPGRLRIGERVRVSELSGVWSGKEAIVSKPFDWREEEGAYKPVPEGYVYLRSLNGTPFTMPRNRVISIDPRTRGLQSNPGPSFIVVDAVTGRVGYTARATGMGDQAIRKCREAAERIANRTGQPQLIFLDIRGVKIGAMMNVAMIRMIGITDEVHPTRPPGRHPDTVGGFEENPHLENSPCPTCSGSLAYQGTLGQREHYRCRDCGLDFNTPITRAPEYRGWKRTCGHGQITNQCEYCRGRRVSSRIKPCPHGISGGGPRCVACQRLYKRGTAVQSNPAIRNEWNTLTERKRMAVLEFAGVSEYMAGSLCRRPWSQLSPEVRRKLEAGWRDTSPRSGETTVRRMVPAMNPGPSGKRKMTITVEQFAVWVKKQNDSKMWKAFLAKFKGYEKWTHGARARKVHLEWVETPGVDGLWITYDGGKQPESTYIMPKGSPRKGAWKHPWDTMPDIKHDPQAGIVLTKLRGRSKITDFYHK